MRYSFSRLSAFWQCSYQYYLEYIKTPYKCKKCGDIRKLPKGSPPPKLCIKCDGSEFEKVVKENNAFAEYGSFVHELLEKYALGEFAEYELLDRYEDEYPIYVNEEFPYNQYVDLADSYYNAAYAYLENFDGFDYLIPNYEILGVEKHFVLEFDSFEFQGYIDLILKDPDDNIIIVDHKSKKTFKNKKERKEYARQLYLYSRYIKEVYGKFPTMLIFNHFRTGTPCVIYFKENEYNEAIEWAKNTVKAIESHKYWEGDVHIDDFYCNELCSYRNVCEYKESG